MLKLGTEVAITGVTPIDKYRLRIRFNDGQITDVDFEPFLQASKHPEILRINLARTAIRITSLLKKTNRNQIRTA